jgi:hypothetical protein
VLGLPYGQCNENPWRMGPKILDMFGDSYLAHWNTKTPFAQKLCYPLNLKLPSGIIRILGFFPSKANFCFFKTWFDGS